uniref:Cyclin-P3-1-like n=1 Tax=Nelumbo nucifera TaxID=4432 RepID=A0A822XK66_NELNU|nr:TPA_asm: hypothetical protein HUJ06_020942 [Nelumbo nucifera]
MHSLSLSVQQQLCRSRLLRKMKRFFNNAYYAKVGGVSLAEMNRLEMKFLFTLDFRLHVTVETFKSYCLLLEKEAAGGYKIERPIQVCRLKESWPKKDEPKHATTIARYSC